MQSKSEYISYEPAITQLRKRLDDVTPEEMAAWIFMSSQQVCAAKNNSGERCCTNEVLHHGDMCESHDGLPTQEEKAKLIERKRHNLVAFTGARELDPPPRFFFGSRMGKRSYLPLLYRCWFKADDIATFEPGERYITGEKLLERWPERNGISTAKRIKIACAESRLNPVHPTLGLSNKARPDYAKLKDGLFSLAEVKAYEREEFGGELEATGGSGDAVGKVEAEPVITTHKLKTKNMPLDAEIATAKTRALDNTSVQSVWDELVKMANKQEGCLIGEGDLDELQYGSRQDPQIFKKKMLGDRMRRG